MSTPRRALCIGVSSFNESAGEDALEPDLTEFAALGYAAEYTRDLHAALRAAGYEAKLLTDPAVLRAVELGGRVERHLNGGGVGVVHVLSHGDYTDAGGVYVIGSDGTRSKTTRVEDWLIEVADNAAAPMTLFLLDLCHAGAAIRGWKPLHDPSVWTRPWVIAATGADKPAYAGRLTRAATIVINDITSGRADLAETVASIGFDVLFTRISQKVEELGVDEDGYPQKTMCTPVMGSYPELPFFPNPRYRPNPAAAAAVRVEPATAPFLDPALDEEHFKDRAAGHGPATGRISAGCFTGRVPQLRRLAAWMDGHDDGCGGLMLVTGSPGAGKSALLGVLVCAAHPQLRDATQRLWRAAAARPSANPGLAAVHARQRSLAEITASLGRQLLGGDGALYPGPDLYPGDDVFPAAPHTPDQLITAIAQLASPPVIVLDALDEALDHQPVVTELLIPLVQARRLDGSPVCRLLIGLRPWAEFSVLFSLAHEVGEVIDLDSIGAEQRRGDIADYVVALLELLPGYTTTAHSRGRRAFASALATTLVPTQPEVDPYLGVTDEPEVRWGEFLVAALYTHTVSLALPDRLTDPAEAARLGAGVPRTLPDVLEHDLAARELSRWRRALLVALAHARGSGIPLSVLSAVLAAMSGERSVPTADQVSAELDALRFYLRTSADTDASALYRLFHQGLADHLRADHQGVSDETSTVADAVFDGMLTTVPSGSRGRRWDLAAPYLLRHAIGHAAEARRVDELLEDPSFLVHADPTTLSPLLHLAGHHAARLAAAVYRVSAGGHPHRSSGKRRDVLAIDAARYGAVNLRRTLLSLPGLATPRWTPRWATGSQISTALHATLTGHDGEVVAVACTEVDGCPVAVTTGRDDTVRIWDMRAGAEIGKPLTRTGGVLTVACSHIDGRPVAVSGGRDGAVRIWDLRTRAEIGNPLTGHTTAVVAVACTEIDGSPVAVTTGYDQTVRRWNLRDGTQIGEPLTGHTSDVVAVACTEIDGSPVAVTTGYDQTVRRWNLRDGTQIGEPLTGHTSDTAAIACTKIDGCPVAVTTGRDDTVRIWDMRAGTPIGRPLTGHTARVLAVACTNLDGAPVAVTTSRDGTVRIWDMRASTPIGRPLTGHNGRVLAVACANIDGAPVAVSGGWDETVRVWNLRDGTPRRPLTGHDGRVLALACTNINGTPVAVSGSRDGTVRVWDLRDSTPVGQPLTGHSSEVFAVACTEIDGVPIAVSGGRGGAVRVWNLRDGTAIASLAGHDGRVLALACININGTPVAVSAGRDGTVRVWDLLSRKPVGKPLKGHSGNVGAVGCAMLDGRPVAVSGGWDGTVQVWDLRSRNRISTLSGHTGPVVDVVCTEIDSVQVAVSAGRDGMVRVWDLRARGQWDVIELPAAAEAIAVSDGNQLSAGFGWDVVVLEGPVLPKLARSAK